MVRTIVTPNNDNISIHVPPSYIGRQVEVLLFAIDELVAEETATKGTNNSSLRGKLNLTDEQYKDFHQHAKDVRSEWSDNI